MTVVQILPALEQGGVENVVLNLNRAVIAAGWQSLVISSGGRLVSAIEQAGGTHLTLDVKSKNPLTFLPRALALRRALQTPKHPNTQTTQTPKLLVCTHSRVPAWLFRFANRKLNLPWISYAHGANSVSKYSEVMTRGDRIVTPSQFLADYLKANYRFDERKLRVIHPAVDTAKFDPAKLDQKFVAEKRREWRLKDGEKVLMAVGRITPVKGYDALLADFAAGKYAAEKLVIVGGADKHHLEYFEQLKAKAGANVVFAGPQEKIPECLALADTVVSANTTKPETFGLSVVEAYAMNKKVVAKRFGGVGEVMAAVESAGAAFPREAVEKLYGFAAFAARTQELYRELV